MDYFSESVTDMGCGQSTVDQLEFSKFQKSSRKAFDHHDCYLF